MRKFISMMVIALGFLTLPHIAAAIVYNADCTETSASGINPPLENCNGNAYVFNQLDGGDLYDVILTLDIYTTGYLWGETGRLNALGLKHFNSATLLSAPLGGLASDWTFSTNELNANGCVSGGGDTVGCWEYNKTTNTDGTEYLAGLSFDRGETLHFEWGVLGLGNADFIHLKTQFVEWKEKPAPGYYHVGDLLSLDIATTSSGYVPPSSGDFPCSGTIYDPCPVAEPETNLLFGIALLVAAGFGAPLMRRQYQI